MSITPGPWKAELLNKGKSNEHWRIGNKDEGNSIVAECMDYASDPLERDDNARLISIAPELLDAVKTFLERIPRYGFECEAGKLEDCVEFEKLSQAIRHATQQA